jgi:hypothetical protein
MARARAILAAAGALGLFVPAVPALASSADPPRHGAHSCGSHTLAGHGWTSYIDGVAHERGTRWLVYRAGAHSSCAFAGRTLAGLLKFSDRYLAAAHSPSPFRVDPDPAFIGPV